MRQLLDTHTLIWFITGDPRIRETVRSQIENNQNCLSIVSIWEIAIKHSIGKLNLNLVK
ncbi:type II toxin-antitoxin system VapC family toxin [Nostoc sp. CMAA1605]|uniref:type II toxin-antitoxin system VapC family toxin n=1 Tax=Nostoc sp. CMAA1605 TaxID=2055159 RepID=UPI001F1E8C24|nr:type II toxin-antitoxin system VapC family toxin [Nostoc sp. CMAA1605]